MRDRRLGRRPQRVGGAGDRRGPHPARGHREPGLATGQVEVGECTVEVLNRAEPPPFPVDDRVDTDEVVRLRHRYVDLRRERLQRNLRARAAANSAIRSSMERQGFVEVETPMLIASTPEGARDFVVPSRLHPGSFYALPQSPQLFKQLTMVGGLDRYYQIARCLRDEDLRADRQFEFMQLDVEASFVGQDEVLAFVSDAVAEATRAVAGAEVGDIPTMTWHDAMERYGSDKPDIRFGMELVELTEVFAATGFKAFAGQTVKGIRVPGAGTETSRKRLDDLTDAAKRWGAKGLVWMRVTEDALDSPVAKFLSDGELGRRAGGARRRARRPAAAGGRRPAGRAPRARPAAPGAGAAAGDRGRAALPVGRRLPAVRGLGDDGRPVPAHHPFTMPHPEDLDLLSSDDPPTCCGCGPRPTTWCSTAGSWARARSGSTGPTCSSRSSGCSASPRTRPRPGSGSCSTPSATGRRPMPASPSGSIGWWRCWWARRTSAR